MEEFFIIPSDDDDNVSDTMSVDSSDDEMFDLDKQVDQFHMDWYGPREISTAHVLAWLTPVATGTAPPGS